jgi:hypothetical protein
MEEKPIIEEGARFNWTCSDELTVVISIDYIDEDGITHLTVKTGTGWNGEKNWRESESIRAKDIYEKVEDGYLEPQ